MNEVTQEPCSEPDVTVTTMFTWKPIVAWLMRQYRYLFPRVPYLPRWDETGDTFHLG